MEKVILWALAQVPPTPTPQPAGTSYFSIPQSVSLWGSVSTAIQWWNWLGSGQIIVQALLIGLLVALGVFSVNRWVKELTGKDAEE